MSPATLARIDSVLGVIEAHCGINDPAVVPILRGTIERVLREQDKQTRHACAEAVTATNDAYYEDTDEPMPCEVWRAVDRAHQAVMNATSV